MLSRQHKALAFTVTAALLAVAAWLLVLGWPRGRPPGPPSKMELDATIARVATLLEQGENERAEREAKKALADLERSGAPETVNAAQLMYVLVSHRLRQGNASDVETRAWATRAVQIRTRELGAEHVDTIESVLLQAKVLTRSGELEAAKDALIATLNARSDGTDANHAVVINARTELGFLHLQTDELAEAQSCFERSLAALGEDHCNWQAESSALNGLAQACYWLGDWAVARTSWERAVEIRERELGKDHPRVASLLANLGALLTEMGDHALADSSLKLVYSIQSQNLPPDHPQLARTIHHLAIAAKNMQRLAEADSLYHRARKLFAAQSLDHPSIPFVFNNLAELRYEQGDYESARRYFEDALEIIKRDAPPDHPRLTLVLDGLARTFHRLRDLERSEGLFDQNLAITRDAYGEEHPEYAESLANLAALRVDQTEYETAFDEALEAERLSRRHFSSTASALSEREALHYSSVRARTLDIAIDLAMRGEKPRVQGAWDAVIRSRSLVLDEMIARRRDLDAIEDLQLRELESELETKSRRLSNMVFRKPVSDDLAVYRRLVDSARRDREYVEKQLARGSASFRRRMAKRLVGLEQVASALPARSALVAFFYYQTGQAPEARDGRLAAFVLSGREREPEICDLGPASAIDSAVQRWSHEVVWGGIDPKRTAAESDSAYRRWGTALRRLVWDPVASKLTGERFVLVVADGSLYGVSFASLPSNDRYLIEDGFRFHYLATERDLTDLQRSGSGVGLLALGGPDFSGNPNTAPPSGAVPCGDLDALWFAPLPFSEVEARRVAALWDELTPTKKDSWGESSLLLSAEATEEAFKAGAPGKRVVHLATHGFFLGDDCSTPVGARSIHFVPRPMPGQARAADTLVLSGLAMAHANTRDSRSIVEEDGVLTADEIARMNLRGVDWAVLSACNTGVGEIRTGEGVFGLRRALQVAGVQTVVMSLWEVADEATAEWMEHLYRARLESNVTTAEALQLASLRVLQERRQQNRSVHPFYWASFVASGEWR